MERIKITDRQLISITATFVVGSSILVMSSSITAVARQDAWLSVPVATLLGLIVVWLNTYLGGLYPDKTLIEINRMILGKWLGGFVNLNFILMALIAATQVVWYVGDFFTTTYMTETPTYVINLVFLAGIVIGMLYGLEVMARTNEIFFYIISFGLLFGGFLLTPNIKAPNLLPVFENGFSPVMKGAIPLLSFSVLPVVILNIIYPVNLGNVKKAKWAIFKGYLLGMAFPFIIVLITVLVLGGTLPANLRFPTFTLIKTAGLGIFTRMEAIMVTIWLLTIFSSAYFYFYAGVVGFAQLIRLPDCKKMVLPFGLIALVFSGFIYWNVPYEMNWDTKVWPFYITTFGLVLPLILLLIIGIRKLLKNRP